MSDIRPFPIQQGGTVPWWLAEIAYEHYASLFGRGQSLERLAQRKGFGREELVGLLRQRDAQALFKGEELK